MKKIIIWVLAATGVWSAGVEDVIQVAYRHAARAGELFLVGRRAEGRAARQKAEQALASIPEIGGILKSSAKCRFFKIESEYNQRIVVTCGQASVTVAISSDGTESGTYQALEAMELDQEFTGTIQITGNLNAFFYFDDGPFILLYGTLVTVGR